MRRAPPLFKLEDFKIARDRPKSDATPAEPPVSAVKKGHAAPVASAGSAPSAAGDRPTQTSEKPPAAATGRKPRADSLRNRERLLNAARDIFSAGGPGASLEAVAREAGVGIGTLYRHFPTREALFQAVYSREVDELVALAAQLGETAPPLEALRTWLRLAVRMIATKKGMVAALAPAIDDPAFYADKGARILAALGGLMERAAAAGTLRADVTPDEVLRMLLGVCYAPSQAAAGWQETATHLLDIFVDGLAIRT